MTRKRKGLYEGMYILSSALSDESRKKALDKITDGISQKEGEILKVFDQGRRRLTYEISGKKEGHYFVLYFEAPTSIVQELWREYHLHEDLVRFMTMRVESVPETLEFKSLKPQG
jgi:small subunit ribosomal protein S6